MADSDYEEGTWTPAVSGNSAAGTVTYSGGRGGTYTKIGNQVTIWFSLLSFSITGASGLFQITGMPFIPSFTNNVRGAFSGNLRFYYMSFPGLIPSINLESGQTSMYILWSRDNTSWVQSTVQNTGSQYIEGYVTYTVA